MKLEKISYWPHLLLLQLLFLHIEISPQKRQVYHKFFMAFHFLFWPFFFLFFFWAFFFSRIELSLVKLIASASKNWAFSGKQFRVQVGQVFMKILFMGPKYIQPIPSTRVNQRLCSSNKVLGPHVLLLKLKQLFFFYYYFFIYSYIKMFTQCVQ